MAASPLRFPAGFRFGVSTSAYQVEGNIRNDWTEWEAAGRLKQPHHCGRGVDHWNRFEEDLTLAGNVGAQAFRVSIEWARLEPERGKWDDAALEGYRQRFVRMREVGMRPVVTLHHFTHPAWFQRETPWHDPTSVVEFRRYARACAQTLKGLDPLVITFNEPMVLLLGGYLQGLIPPGIADGPKAMLALANIVRAHAAAREELVNALGKVEVGISQNMLVFAPDRAWNPLDRLLAHFARYNYNRAILEALITGRLRINMPGMAQAKVDIPQAKDSLDFLGVNYYTRAHLRFTVKKPFVSFRYRDVHGRGLTHIGWEDYPEGFGQTLREAQRYGLPIWVTENGIDDRDGDRRTGYLHTHWQQMLEAAQAGVDLRGYLYWSLMDNFEWLDGWGPRFGLYAVDFETLERRPTPACDYFRKVATTLELANP